MKEQDRIDEYLNGALSPEDRDAFEAELGINPPLRELAENQRFAISALERNWLRKQMKAGLGYFRYYMTALAILLISGLCIGYGHYHKAKEGPQVHDKIEAPFHEELHAGLQSEPTRQVQETTESQATNVPQFPRQDIPKTRLNIVPVMPDDESPSEVEKPDYPMPADPSVLHGADTEVFLVNNVTDTTLVTSRGLRIFLPAGCLVHSDGSRITAPAQIRIRYFADYLHLWADKVNTTTIDHKLLISAGSCEIRAFTGSQEVGISELSACVVQFPGKRDSLMQTYYGDRDSMGRLNWDPKPSELYLPPSIRQVKIDSLYERSFYVFSSRLSDNIPLRDSVSGNTFTGILAKDSSFTGYFDSFNSLPQEYIQYLYEHKKHLQMSYKFRNGQFQGFDFMLFGTTKKEKRMERKIQRFARKLPSPVQPAATSAGQGALTATLSPEMHKVYTFDTLVRIDSSLRSDIKAKLQMQNFNTLVIRKFGYVNSDYFPAQLQTINVHFPEGNEQTEVRLFFVRYKAALTASCGAAGCRIQGIPSGEPVLMVCLSPGPEGLNMALSESVTSEIMHTGKMEPFQEEKLKRFLNQTRTANESGAISANTKPW